MIIRTILIAALNLFTLVSYAQLSTQIGKNILVELPQGATKYVDTVSANLLSKNFGVAVSADKLPMNKYSYKVGNLIYQFYDVAKVSVKQSQAPADDVRLAEASRRKKNIINGITFLIDSSDGNKDVFLRFYCFSQKSGTALRGFITFPIEERSAALLKVEKVFQTVKFLD